MPARIQKTQPSVVTEWVLNVFGLDGLMPIIVLLVPVLFQAVLGRNFFIEILAIILPVAAFFWRGVLSSRKIEGNRCGKLLRLVQRAALLFALLLMALVDAFAILVWTIPKGGLTLGDYLTTGILYLLYLSLLAVALYPGLRVQSDQGLQPHG